VLLLVSRPFAHGRSPAAHRSLTHLSDGPRPVTILIQELPGGGSRIAYDSVVSALEGYGDPESLKVAGHLDDEVLTLLRSAA
jgi:hypothetical protein